MAKQHIHVCMNHMHTHINTHAHTSGREGEGRESTLFKVYFRWLWLTESDIKSTGYRCEYLVFNGAPWDSKDGWGLSEELNSVLGVKGPSIA